MNFFSSFILIIYPLHVSNRLTIHHQELVNCICSIWYLSCLYVDQSLARSEFSPHPGVGFSYTTIPQQSKGVGIEIKKSRRSKAYGLNKRIG